MIDWFVIDDFNNKMGATEKFRLADNPLSIYKKCLHQLSFSNQTIADTNGI
jgi:hypothetical protein